MNPKERIEELTALLKEAGYRYYVLDDPTMEDWPQRILPPSGWAGKP